MSVDKRIGLNLSLSYSEDGTSYTPMAAIVDIDSIGEMSTEEVDTTLLADTFMTSEPSQIDPGEVSFTLAHDPANAEVQKCSQFMRDRSVIDWRVTFAAKNGNPAVTEDFSGWVKSFGGGSVSKQDMVTSSVVIRKSGDSGVSGE